MDMLFSVLFWGLTLSFLGKLFLVASVIFVHNKITQEKHIDGIVLMEMHREKIIALLGIALMLAGYLLELEAYDFLNLIQGTEVFR